VILGNKLLPNKIVAFLASINSLLCNFRQQLGIITKYQILSCGTHRSFPLSPYLLLPPVYMWFPISLSCLINSPPGPRHRFWPQSASSIPVVIRHSPAVLFSPNFPLGRRNFFHHRLCCCFTCCPQGCCSTYFSRSRRGHRKGAREDVVW
jgi:hypothetical protein